MTLLFDLHRRRNTTLILVTHEMALAERCGRTLHIADGRIVGDETRVLQSTPMAAARR